MKKGWILIAVFAALLALGFNTQQALAQGSVIGQVIDADEDPVAGAIVTIGGQGGRGERPFRATTETNERGVFEFERIPAGDYHISAMARGIGGARAEIEVIDREVTRVRLQIEGRNDDDDDEREVGAIVGNVRTADGDPAAGAYVTVFSMQRERGQRHRHLSTRTDREGNFNFVNVPEGNYIIHVALRGEGMARARLEVVADQRNGIRLVLNEFNHNDEDDDNDRGNWRRHRDD
ncbi:MAG: carboxypeptidase-like regulatory domain-containing protein [Candidatus Hatepunaea meridiana]|nr:carboxypeptidase-like regulatory domain-containing protein [Candidatus Hatepunaea meridiana]